MVESERTSGSRGQRPHGGGRTGHTLVELVLVVSILSLALVGCGLLSRGLQAAEERGAAQVLQVALAASQLHQQWQTSEVRVEATPSGIQLVSADGRRQAYMHPGTRSLSANVPAWRTAPDSVALRITGTMASPDSGGTISLGERAGVVVRPESGFTRRIP
jgi:type II secretory pathway pseudopilin PulG